MVEKLLKKNMKEGLDDNKKKSDKIETKAEIKETKKANQREGKIKQIGEAALQKAERNLEKIFTFFENHFLLTVFLFFLASLTLRLALTPYHIVLRKDAYTYLIHALDIAKGNFSPKLLTSSGWPLFLAPFLKIFENTTFFSSIFDKMVIARIISNIIDASCIFPIALIGRKLLSKKALLVLLVTATVVSPLLLLSGSGLSEPLFTLFLLLTVLFIIKSMDNRNYVLLATIFASLAYVTRFNGIFLLPVVLLSFFLLRRHIPNYRQSYLIYAFLAFCLVAVPILIQRYAHFDSLFYYGEVSKYFADSYQHYWSYNIPVPTLSEYLSTHTLLDYINKFVVRGFFSILAYYLWFTIPSSLLFFFLYGCARKITSKLFIPLGVMFTIWIIGLTIPWDMTHTERYLFPTIPFILIISAAGMILLIKEYRFAHTLLSLFLVCFVLLSLLPAASQWYDYKKEEQPQLEWGRWAAAHLHGRVATFHGDTISYFLEDIKIGKTDPVYMYSITSNLSFLHPGYFEDLPSAMRWYFDMNVSYFVLDKATLNRRPYLKEINSEIPYLKKMDTGKDAAGKEGTAWEVDIYFFDHEKFRRYLASKKINNSITEKKISEESNQQGSPQNSSAEQSSNGENSQMEDSQDPEDSKIKPYGPWPVPNSYTS